MSTSPSPSVLEAIVAAARRRVETGRQARSLADLERVAADIDRTARADFAAALRAPGIRVIAECKRRSPSRGVLLHTYNPVWIAQDYARAGAAAVSVLTEPTFFDGDLDHLAQVHRALPATAVLRKDFIVEEWQIAEAAVSGASAVLLILAALDQAAFVRLHRYAEQLGLDVLSEVHDEDEARRAVDGGATIVGVNNRNLRTLEVSLETSIRLAERLPDAVVRVAESGLRTGEDLARLRGAGYDAFLIGERLMTDADPGTGLGRLIAEALEGDRKGRPYTDRDGEEADASTSAKAPADRSERRPYQTSQRWTRVKVCGITSVEDARLAVEAGADAIGLVFWPASARAVDLATAQAIVAAVPAGIATVGVFVNETPARVREVADAVGLSAVQLHGDEVADEWKNFPRVVTKALTPEAFADSPWTGARASILLDAHDPVTRGGTGRTVDWQRARTIAASRSIVLAGGLTPDNVTDAVLAVRPWAVDVASGVESRPGVKDAARVKAFVQAVRAADAQIFPTPGQGASR